MEKSISDSIIKKINKIPGCFAYKRLSNGSTSTNGYPDITGTVNIHINGQILGIRLEIESKQPGKRPTQLQYSRLRKFRSLGCVAFWTDNPTDAMNKIKLWQDILSDSNNQAGKINYNDLFDPKQRKPVVLAA